MAPSVASPHTLPWPALPSAVGLWFLCIALASAAFAARSHAQRRRRWTAAAMRSPPLLRRPHRYEEDTDKQPEGSRTQMPLLNPSPNSMLNHPGLPLIELHREQIRSGDLAFALSLPRPSLHPYTSFAAEAPPSTSPDAAFQVQSMSRLGYGTNAVEEAEGQGQVSNDDAVSVSPDAKIFTAINVAEGISFRLTDMLAEHPHYRRRVRSWEVGAATRDALRPASVADMAHHWPPASRAGGAADEYYGAEGRRGTW